MKLILTAPIDKLGVPGDIVEVKDGYGRNYLLPNNYAIRWTRGAEVQIDQIKRARAAKEIKTKEQAELVRSQLEDLKVQITVQAGESGRLFGAVTPADIALAVKKAGGPA
ncbi:50S ribosomal protein L9, partial [Cutibacterium granulosum]